jgi:hypothetical protein
MNPKGMARFVRKWFSEWEPDPPLFGRATDILNHLIDENPDMAWERICALVAQAKPESLCYVVAGPLEDLLMKHGSAIIDRVESLTTSDPRFLSSLAGVRGHISFEPAIFARVQRLVDQIPQPNPPKR